MNVAFMTKPQSLVQPPNPLTASQNTKPPKDLKLQTVMQAVMPMFEIATQTAESLHLKNLASAVVLYFMPTMRET